MRVIITSMAMKNSLTPPAEVQCTYKSRGCRKVMRYSELECHIKSCVYGFVNCPLKCGNEMTIKSLSHHMSTLCPRRVVTCQYCDDDIPLDTKNDHETNCHKKPVTCGYCHHQSIMQGDMSAHLEVCPMRPRNCRLTPLGCTFSGNKSDIEAHESKWDCHIDLVLKHIIQNNNSNQEKGKNRLANIIAIVKDLNGENELLKERVNEMTEKVESLQSGNKTLKDQLHKLETTHKADVTSMRTLVEVLRKEIEELRIIIFKQKDDDEESEV